MLFFTGRAANQPAITWGVLDIQAIVEQTKKEPMYGETGRSRVEILASPVKNKGDLLRKWQLSVHYHHFMSQIRWQDFTVYSRRPGRLCCVAKIRYKTMEFSAFL